MSVSRHKINIGELCLELLALLASRTGTATGGGGSALQQRTRAWESWPTWGMSGDGTGPNSRTEQNRIRCMALAHAHDAQVPFSAKSQVCSLHHAAQRDCTHDSSTTLQVQRHAAGPAGGAGARAQILYKLHVHVQHTSHLSVTLTAPSAQPHFIVCCSVVSAPRMRAHQVTSLASGLSSSDHRASALKHWAQSTMRGGEPRGLAGAPR